MTIECYQAHQKTRRDNVHFKKLQSRECKKNSLRAFFEFQQIYLFINTSSVTLQDFINVDAVWCSINVHKTILCFSCLQRVHFDFLFNNQYENRDAIAHAWIFWINFWQCDCFCVCSTWTLFVRMKNWSTQKMKVWKFLREWCVMFC